MQVGRYKYSIRFEGFRLSGKEVKIIAEIGLGEIVTATSFVDYLCEKYGISRSGLWYCLKKLKKEELIEFTEKGEEYKPLRLTEKGIGTFRTQISHIKDAKLAQVMGVRATF